MGMSGPGADTDNSQCNNTPPLYQTRITMDVDPSPASPPPPDTTVPPTPSPARTPTEPPTVKKMRTTTTRPKPWINPYPVDEGPEYTASIVKACDSPISVLSHLKQGHRLVYASKRFDPVEGGQQPNLKLYTYWCDPKTGENVGTRIINKKGPGYERIVMIAPTSDNWKMAPHEICEYVKTNATDSIKMTIPLAGTNTSYYDGDRNKVLYQALAYLVHVKTWGLIDAIADGQTFSGTRTVIAEEYFGEAYRECINVETNELDKDKLRAKLTSMMRSETDETFMRWGFVAYKTDEAGSFPDDPLEREIETLELPPIKVWATQCTYKCTPSETATVRPESLEHLERWNDIYRDTPHASATEEGVDFIRKTLEESLKTDKHRTYTPFPVAVPRDTRAAWNVQDLVGVPLGGALLMFVTDDNALNRVKVTTYRYRTQLTLTKMTIIHAGQDRADAEGTRIDEDAFGKLFPNMPSLTAGKGVSSADTSTSGMVSPGESTPGKRKADEALFTADGVVSPAVNPASGAVSLRESAP